MARNHAGEKNRAASPLAVRFRAQDVREARQIARRHGLTLSAVLRMAAQQGLGSVKEKLKP